MRLNTKIVWLIPVVALVVSGLSEHRAQCQGLSERRTAAFASTIRPMTSKTTTSPLAAARKNAERLLKDLDEGIRFLESDAQSDYTADVVMQERLTTLLTPEYLACKFRRSPSSFYLRWRRGHSGREILFVNGTNNDRLKIHRPGKFPRLLDLAPDSWLIMRERRYPITEFGLLPLANKVRGIIATDLRSDLGASQCRVARNQRLRERHVTKYTLVHDRRELDSLYRKTILLMDDDWKVPLSITSYTWPSEDLEESDEETIDRHTLIEKYVYLDVKFEALQDDAFDETNPLYGFE